MQEACPTTTMISHHARNVRDHPNIMADAITTTTIPARRNSQSRLRINMAAQNHPTVLRKSLYAANPTTTRTTNTDRNPPSENRPRTEDHDLPPPLIQTVGHDLPPSLITTENLAQTNENPIPRYVLQSTPQPTLSIIAVKTAVLATTVINQIRTMITTNNNFNKPCNVPSTLGTKY